MGIADDTLNTSGEHVCFQCGGFGCHHCGEEVVSMTEDHIFNSKVSKSFNADMQELLDVADFMRRSGRHENAEFLEDMEKRFRGTATMLLEVAPKQKTRGLEAAVKWLSA
jgi:formate hydrogenlyase subunit 6/NADH:ubiquinone oxidoreductase subunit I